MIYPSIDKLLNIVDSKFLLVDIVAARVDEMEREGNYQMKEEEYVSKKNVGKALEELANGYVHIEK